MQMESEGRLEANRLSVGISPRLWDAFVYGWRWIVACLLLGVVVAIAFVFIGPKKWETSVYVQIAQVGSVGQGGAMPVESAYQAIERINSPSFQMEVARTLNDQDWLHEIERSGKASGIFKIYASKTTGWLELKVFGESPAKAKAVTEAIVALLVKRHQEALKVRQQKLNAELSIAQDELKALEADTDVLEKTVNSRVMVDERRFPAYTILSLIRASKEQKAFTLRQAILALQVATSPPATLPTMIVEPIYVPTQPNSPKALEILVFGIMAGLVSGLILAYVRYMGRGRKTNSVS